MFGMDENKDPKTGWWRELRPSLPGAVVAIVWLVVSLLVYCCWIDSIGKGRAAEIHTRQEMESETWGEDQFEPNVYEQTR